MFHLGFRLVGFRRTLLIPQFGGELQGSGDFGEFLVFFEILRILFRRCGFDSLVGIHIEDILGNQIQW